MPRFLPQSEGLYDPNFEHDACGVGFVAHLKGEKSHEIVSKGLELLTNLEHRGAVGAEKNAGDGAGILVQIPHSFFQKISSELGFDLPEYEHYGVGQVFLPPQADALAKSQHIFEQCVADCGQEVLGWRAVPNDNTDLGDSVKSVEPAIFQVFIKRGSNCATAIDFERKLFVIRKYSEKAVLDAVPAAHGFYYIGSLSYKTIVYKGQLITNQLRGFFDDLKDPEFASAISLVHSRFSTNTFPSWPLAQPFRYVAHNGEINTLRGNINWMKAREAILKSDVFTDDELEKILPVLDEDGSDSAVLDNAIEFLTLAGRPLSHVMMMLIPEAWQKDDEMDAKRRAFYEFHATLMEPWDGPASVAFTDGIVVGATLDRNGLRPSRYCLSKDNILVMASEQGGIEFAPEDVVLKGRLQPGKMFLANLEEGRIIPDDEIKDQLAAAHPYEEWVQEQKIDLCDLPLTHPVKQPDHETILTRQKSFGYTLEELKLLIEPMMTSAYEATGSMGTDTPVSALSNMSINLFNYFHQLFAQVTNPPIDPIREEAVMSLVTFLGPQGNLLDATDDRYFVEIPQPILTNEEMARLCGADTEHLKAKTIPILFDPKTGSLKKALEIVCDEAIKAVQSGVSVVVLSDHGMNQDHAAIPSLLATAAVHNCLIKAGLRSQCGLVIETGEAREIHHFAVMIGYGANAINPYLVFESVKDMQDREFLDASISQADAEKNYIHAVGKGLLKIMSKMGISTVQSYMGAQIFEALGVGEELITDYFCNTPSRLGGIGMDELEEETLMRHRFAYPSKVDGDESDVEIGGHYQWRQRGERHLFSPDVIHLLQRASRENNYEVYQQFASLINDQNEELLTLRGMLEFQNQNAIPIDEVESVDEICKRFATGAMSYGSISKEAHTTLAIAMNRIGAKSNTGEGGEDPERFTPKDNGDSECSAIKQVASGRFGVTSNYLVNSKEIQIKIAQGAKPGEGGQLPGHKVNDVIGKVRHSTPGVTLISPPPHHDIYSIEDLAQLIHDLKNANTTAGINVKLVSEVGVGTIAAGVAKAHADVVLISGYDGGTGASPQTSIKHAGLPWELGLAETHQVLVKNRLRNRIVVQTDGQLRTGRDLAIATLLGAEEWGVATAALVAVGCIMMRKCHLNTCPVGIATQDEDLRAKFDGEADHVVNYAKFMAQELREVMAELGFKTVDEMVGRVDKLKARDNISHWKAKTLKLDHLLHKMAEGHDGQHFCYEEQDHGLEEALDNTQLLEIAKPALDNQTPVKAEIRLRNINRTVGTILSAEVSRRYGEVGLPHDTIYFKATGSGGQSFSAFGAKGVTFEIEGDVNDYLGKGLCGSRLILYPPRVSTFVPDENVIAGNVAFYGATSGEAYIRGLAGERFCVRNSGVQVVVEAVGDHGCEYMTGGRVVILGEIGRNFAAGMSGGIAYIYDPEKKYSKRINPGLVDLETIEDELEMADVQRMLENHKRFTGSTKAEEILKEWTKNVKHFTKVMPRDYKRVLLEREAAASVA